MFESYREIKDYYRHINWKFVFGYSALILFAAGLGLYGIFSGQQYHAWYSAALALSAFVAIISPRAGQITWIVLIILCVLFVHAPVSPEEERLMELMGPRYESPNNANYVIVDLVFLILPILTYAHCGLKKEQDKEMRRLYVKRRNERALTLKEGPSL